MQKVKEVFDEELAQDVSREDHLEQHFLHVGGLD
jgi:hypothetical protein